MAPFFGILDRFSHEVAEATGDERFNTIHLEIARGMPDNVTTEMDLALWRCSQRLRNDPESARIFENSSAEELATKFLSNSLPPLAQEIVAEFLEAYGARGLGEIDFGRVRWGEDPTHVMQVLQSYLTIDDPELAPDVVFKRGAQAAEEAAEYLVEAVRKLPGGRIKARLVRFAIGRYRSVGGMREAPKFFAIRMMGIARQGLLKSSQEFAEAGLLDQPDDLFFLYIRELDEIAQKAEFPPDIRARIAERRALRQREMLRKQIPRVLLSDGTAFYEGVSAPEGETDAIIGDPVSPGIVEGDVRVVLNPHETQLEPGEILVCPGTDPAWTPLFLAAGGLVMEVGGMMTHGSVVAREYGIPAVVGVHKATERLETGQRIRVNGSNGQITVISDQ
jgi:pyruvate,water dikinase